MRTIYLYVCDCDCSNVKASKCRLSMPVLCQACLSPTKELTVYQPQRPTTTRESLVKWGGSD